MVALLPSVRACVQCVPGPDFTLLHGVNKKQMKQLLLARKKKTKKKKMHYHICMGHVLPHCLPACLHSSRTITVQLTLVSVVPFE